MTETQSGDYDRHPDGSLTLLGKQQMMHAHVTGECGGCGSALHDRYPSREQRLSLDEPIGDAAWSRILEDLRPSLWRTEAEAEGVDW